MHRASWLDTRGWSGSLLAELSKECLLNAIACMCAPCMLMHGVILKPGHGMHAAAGSLRSALWSGMTRSWLQHARCRYENQFHETQCAFQPHAHMLCATHACTCSAVSHLTVVCTGSQALHAAVVMRCQAARGRAQQATNTNTGSTAATSAPAPAPAGGVCGAYLHGPVGSGKTMLVGWAICSSMNVAAEQMAHRYVHPVLCAPGARAVFHAARRP